MQNLAIFLESNKDAAYYRQQVSERGILEKIDDLNEGLLNIKGVTEENLPLVYEMLNEVEISLTKNANDPRTRMALQKFTIDDEKDEEKTVVTEDDDTNGTKGEPDLTGEPTDEPDPTEKVDTQELTGEPTGEPDTENIKGTDPDGGVIGEQGEQGEVPTGEPDPTEKVDTQEPTGEPDPAEKTDTSEPTTETPEPKKGGRRKKTETAE